MSETKDKTKELVSEMQEKKNADVFNADGTVTLKNGSIATLKEFKGRHIREATKAADGDQSKMLFAMMAMCIEIDGKPIVMEDLDDMNGGDCLKLQGAFAELNF